MDIRTESITQILGNSEILKGIDFKVQSKEFIGIIGPNGSGKSTFLKCLYRVAKPKGGVIYFDNQEIDALSYRTTAKKVAVVAQHNDYAFDFTVEQVVLMGRTPHKKLMESYNSKDYKLTEEALEKVGMTAMKARKFSTLSGGEQQRVILARALTQDTECLILDEPTNHLDIKYQLQLMNIVKALNLTVVAAIHDLNIAAMYCDRIFALKKGKLVAEGTPAEVLTPEQIYAIYDVHAKRVEDPDTGCISIIYRSEWEKPGS